MQIRDSRYPQVVLNALKFEKHIFSHIKVSNQNINVNILLTNYCLSLNYYVNAYAQSYRVNKAQICAYIFLFKCFCSQVRILCIYVCTKRFLKNTTNSSCVCAHLVNKVDTDTVFIYL